MEIESFQSLQHQGNSFPTVRHEHNYYFTAAEFLLCDFPPLSFSFSFHSSTSGAVKSAKCQERKQNIIIIIIIILSRSLLKEISNPDDGSNRYRNVSIIYHWSGSLSKLLFYKVRYKHDKVQGSVQG